MENKNNNIKDLTLGNDSNSNNNQPIVKDFTLGGSVVRDTATPVQLSTQPNSQPSTLNTNASGHDTVKPISTSPNFDVYEHHKHDDTFDAKEQKHKDAKIVTNTGQINPAVATAPIKEVSGEKPVENTFYTKRKPQKNKWYKTKGGKWGIVVTTLAVIGLSVGLGLYYGLSGGSKSDIIFQNPSGDSNEEALKDYLENVEQQNWANQIEALKKQAIVWAYDEASTAIPNADKKKKDAEEKAEKDVETEKDQYRADYGGSWEEEWNKYIINSGYDNEEQYQNAKVADSLKGEVSALYTKAGDMTESIYVPTVNGLTDASDEHASAMTMAGDEHYYVSTEAYAKSSNDTTTHLLAIKNGKNGEDGNFEPNIQKYLTLYLQSYKPVNAIDMLLPFTIQNAPQDGLQSGIVSWADVTQLGVFYQNMVDLALASMPTNADAVYFDILGRMEITDGVKSLTSPAYTQQAMTNAIISIVYFGSAIFNTYDLDPADGNAFEQFDLSKAFDYWYSIYESIGSHFAGASDGPTMPGADFPWPGYVADDGTVTPVTPTPGGTAEKKANILAVKNPNSAIDYWGQITTNDLANIGLLLAKNASWSTVVGNYNANILRPIAVVMPVWSTTGRAFESITGTTAGNSSYIVTFGSDGIHVTTFFYTVPQEFVDGYGNDEITPDTEDISQTGNSTIYYFDDGVAPNDYVTAGVYTAKEYQSQFTRGASVLGERQLISDLNQTVDKQNGKEFAPDLIPASGFGILDDFATWMTNNFEALALNEALNDPEFLEQNNLDPVVNNLTEEQYEDFENLPEDFDLTDDTWTELEKEFKYTSIVNNFYNSIYQTQYSAWLNSYTSYKTHIEKYDTIYQQINFANHSFDTQWMQNSMWWEHDYEADTNGNGVNDGWFVYHPIDFIITNGGEI